MKLLRAAVILSCSLSAFIASADDDYVILEGAYNELSMAICDVPEGTAMLINVGAISISTAHELAVQYCDFDKYIGISEGVSGKLICKKAEYGCGRGRLAAPDQD